MAIPNYDHNNVLPPHLGDPRQSSEVSPYPCEILEFCRKFATSNDRIQILKGFLEFRKEMQRQGISQGFQWIDGSFVEDIEKSENRSPNDIDVLTFHNLIPNERLNQLNIDFPEFSNFELSKLKYKVDHYPLDYCFNPEITVEMTRYWIQLFTHNRNKVWKGILRLEINTPAEDIEASNFLNLL